jgi:hypothetical protein
VPTFTKIEVAEAHLTTAIRLFLSDQHPVPIHLLASSAREIMTTLGVRLGTNTVLHDMAKGDAESLKDAYKKMSHFVGFMKHADRDPAGVLDQFDDTDNDAILFVATTDFARVTGGMPIEVQVYQAWFYATFVKRVSQGGLRWQRSVKRCIAMFPGIRGATREEQKAIGLAVLHRVQHDPQYEMEIRRTVELRDEDEGTG